MVFADVVRERGGGESARPRLHRRHAVAANRRGGSRKWRGTTPSTRRIAAGIHAIAGQANDRLHIPRTRFRILHHCLPAGGGSMKAGRGELLDYVVRTIEELSRDWDYSRPVGPESLLFTELGLESLHVLAIRTAIHHHSQSHLPPPQLLHNV